MPKPGVTWECSECGEEFSSEYGCYPNCPTCRLADSIICPVCGGAFGSVPKFWERWQCSHCETTWATDDLVAATAYDEEQDA